MPITENLDDAPREEDKNTYFELQQLMRSPEATELRIRDVASHVQYEINDLFGSEKRSTKLTPENFLEIYDQTAPTVFVDLDQTFSGVTFAGPASHDPEVRTNIIYATAACGAGNIVKSSNGEHAFLIQSGVMVGKDNQVYYGELPSPQLATAMETSDITTLRQCQELGVEVLSDPQSIEKSADKGNLSQVIGGLAVKLADRLDPSEAIENLKDGAEIVVKPSHTARGIGIVIAGADHDPEHVRDVYDFLEKSNYDPLVESRIASWPVTDPATGRRLDWNVRAIVSHGTYIGMYVRADYWGNAVNRTTGSQTLTIDEFLSYLPSEENAAYIKTTLESVAMQFEENGQSGLLGLDLTINEEGEPCLFELNEGFVGGVQTMAKLETDPAKKLDKPKQVLASWHKKFTPQKPRIFDAVETVALESSFTSFTRTAIATGLDKQLAKLRDEDLPHESPNDRLGIVHTYLARRQQTLLTLDQKALGALDQKLVDLYPLELRDELPYIVGKRASSALYMQYARDFNNLFPNDREWVKLRLVFEIAGFDLSSAQNTYKELLQSGHNPEKLAAQTKVNLRRHPINEYYGDELEFEDEIELQKMLAEACLQFFETDYPAVKLSLQTQKEQASNPEIRRQLELMQVLMAIMCKEFEDARLLIDESSYDIMHSLEFTEYLNHGIQSVLRTSPEGLVLLTDLEIANDRVTEALVSAVIYGQNVNDKTLAIPVFLHIANSIPFEGSDTDRRILTQQLIDVALNNPHTYAFESQSDLATYGTLFIDYMYGRPTNVAEKFSVLIQKYPQFEGDFAYLSDLFAEVFEREKPHETDAAHADDAAL